MPSIFISYRRSDSMAYTGRIYDRVVAAFGEKNIFKDVEDIPAGMDFREVLDKALTASDVVLVIIGQQWLYVSDDRGKRRLSDPNDFVRLEVETALQRSDVLVIPVLINNAAMPAADQLPGGLKELAFRNSVVIRDDPDFNRDISKLIQAIQSRSKKPNRLPLILGVVALLAIIALALVILLPALTNPDAPPATAVPTEAIVIAPTDAPTSTLAPTDVPTNTPENTPEATAAVSAPAGEPTVAYPDGRPLTFFYDRTTFVVQNPNAASVAFLSLSFEALGADGQPNGSSFSGAKWDEKYKDLLRGGCGSIELPLATKHLEPAACRLYNARVNSVTASEIFWVSTSFRVLWDGAEVGRCLPDAGTCTVNIPPA